MVFSNSSISPAASRLLANNHQNFCNCCVDFRGKDNQNLSENNDYETKTIGAQ